MKSMKVWFNTPHDPNVVEGGGFKDLMKSWWLGRSFRGSSCFILVEKLKNLIFFLKRWNSEVFGNVAVRKNLTLT